MKIRIGENEANQRFDRFLRKYFKNSPEIKLTQIYSRIRKGLIKVNNKKTSQEYKLIEGDEIFIDEKSFDIQNPVDYLKPKSEKKETLNLQKLKNCIIFEDENYIFWDKKPGIAIHPGDKHTADICLNDMLGSYISQTQPDLIKNIFEPAFGFRLDKDTSGVIVAGKTYESLKYLNEIIRKRKVDKLYHTIVIGKFPAKLEIKDNLATIYDKDIGKKITIVDRNGDEAKTYAKLLETKKDERLGDISLVEVKILTGRMHQIRVHLAHKGYPVLGDMIYGDKEKNKVLARKYKITRQLLHSYQYSFYDTFTSHEIKVKSNIPEDFRILFG